jgi:uncharacterized membrane protein YbaN (DUF454 family)
MMSQLNSILYLFADLNREWPVTMSAQYKQQTAMRQHKTMMIIVMMIIILIIIIMWKVDPLLDNDRERRSYSIAVTE